MLLQLNVQFERISKLSWKYTRLYIIFTYVRLAKEISAEENEESWPPRLCVTDSHKARRRTRNRRLG